MGFYDRLGALGRGAAQGATGGLVDDIYPKILQALPFDDGTGIPREYEGGSAAGQYAKEYKADDAAAASKFPASFASGQALGAAPAALATGGLGGAGQVAAGAGLGAVQGYGNSERGGIDRIKDAVKGGALGGAFGAAGNVAAAAAPAAKQAWQNLKQGPPPGLQPALAGSSVSRSVPRPVEQVGGPQINRALGNYDDITDIPMPRKATPPPRPSTGDLQAPDRPSLPPVDVTKPFPKNTKVPEYHGMPEAEVDLLEKRLRQTEANGAKKIEARAADRNDRPPGRALRPVPQIRHRPVGRHRPRPQRLHDRLLGADVRTTRP